jgi:very-short-patch-repair endonuclease
MERFNNLPHLLERRRQLRQKMTWAEEVIWKYVRRKGLGVKFRRQQSFKNFIIDFYCSDLQLAIEVDGDTHLDEEVQQYDAWRQQQLEDYNIQFIRIPNPRLLVDADQVANEIRQAVNERQRAFIRPEYSKLA